MFPCVVKKEVMQSEKQIDWATKNFSFRVEKSGISGKWRNQMKYSL